MNLSGSVQHGVTAPYHVDSVLMVAVRMRTGETEALGNLPISLDLEKVALVSNPIISTRSPELTGLSAHGAKSTHVCSNSSEDAYQHLHPWGGTMLGFRMSTKRTAFQQLCFTHSTISKSSCNTQHQSDIQLFALDTSLLQGITSQGWGRRCHLTHYLFTLRGRTL